MWVTEDIADLGDYDLKNGTFESEKEFLKA